MVFFFIKMKINYVTLNILNRFATQNYLFINFLTQKTGLV